MRTHIRRAGTLFGLLLALPAAHAGSLMAGNDISVSGGFAGGYYRTSNIGVKDVDDYSVSDYLVNLSAESKDGSIGFTGAFGFLSQGTVFNGGVSHPTSAPSMDFQYGYVTVPTGGGVTFDAGMLATMIGYEVAPTFSNANILLGAVWNAQPVYYTGVRATYAANGFNVFAEANDDAALGGSKSAVFGVNGSAAGMNYVVNYGNGFNGKDIIDIIVSGTVAGVDAAVNLDYQKLDNQVGSLDDSAYGLALYATVPVSEMVTVPVRVEYISDGTSGIYGGFDSGYTLTITPTYHASANTFVRGEVAYVTSDNNIFLDDAGAPTDNNTSFAVQAGVTF